MIQKYSSFINENHTNTLSVHEKINEPFTSFIERAQERLDSFKQLITELLKEMDRAIEEVNESFNNIIVGSPEFEIDDDQIKKALVSVIKQKVKSMLRMKSDLADKYPISKDLKEFVNGKFTKGENEFINEVINEILSTIEDSDNLEDFAEWYREEISDYYEDEAMETQGV